MAKEYWKSPSAVLNFGIDWSDWLETGDSIATSSWAVDTGITEDSDTNTTTTATITVSGGTDGTAYNLTNTITTANGLTDQRAIVVNVGTAIAGEPVSLEEAKRHVRQDIEDDDNYISMLITCAREYAEGFQNRRYLTKTDTLVLDSFPGVTQYRGNPTIYVPNPPLQSITSIQYKDTQGDTQTLDASKYIVDTDREPGRIVPAFGETWPSTYGEINDVTVTYVAGYGDVSDVPEKVKLAILHLVAHWYENREPVAFGMAPGMIPKHVESLLWQDRVSIIQ